MLTMSLRSRVSRSARLLLFLFLPLFLLASCAAPDVSHYAANQPALDPARYFAGDTDAWGIVQARNGEVLRRFRVAMHGAMRGGVFELDERFTYDDGETQRRVWTLVRQADGTWRGAAPDVVGEARGRVAGNALHWRYTLRLPVRGTMYDVQLDDWMFLVDGDTLVNRSSLRKFGFEVAQVTLFFRKRCAEGAC